MINGKKGEIDKLMQKKEELMGEIDKDRVKI